MWRRVWHLAGCTTLALAACGRSERSPGDESGGSTAGFAQGGGTNSGGTNSGGTNSGGTNSGGSAGAGASTGGKQATTGGASGGGGDTPLGGTAGALGGGPSTTDAGASTAGSASSSCNRYYHACGCGCCSAQTTQTCVYPGVGPDFDELIAADSARRMDTAGCASAGCSVGQDYFCCEPPPPEDDGAGYEASVYVGGYDRVWLNKTGAVDCSTFALTDKRPSGQAFPVELPPGSSWSVDEITRSPCGSSPVTPPRAIGAIGKFNLRLSGDACVVDAHLSAFFVDAQGGVDAERFDADGVPVSLSAAFCK